MSTETDLKAMKTSQLWQEFTKAGLGATREKNRGWLIEKILAARGEATPEPASEATPEATPAVEPEPTSTDTEPAPALDALPNAPADNGDDGDAQDTSGADRKLTKLSLDELLAKYAEVVGRPTKSDNRAYLIWKIREAQKGRVPVGPTQRAPKHDPDVKMMVLPLRMAEPDVEALDAAWRRLGFKSRMEFLRHAIDRALEGRAA